VQPSTTPPAPWANHRRTPCKKPTAAPPLHAAKTVHPSKQQSAPTSYPLPTLTAPPRHRHFTVLLSGSATYLPPLAASSSPRHATPLSFPDVMHITETPFTPTPASLVSQSSEGALWQIGRLAQGFGAAMDTNTIYFINVPHGCKATYLRIVAAMRPENANPRHVRLTVGGNRIYYPDDVLDTKTADQTSTKLLINSTISKPFTLRPTSRIFIWTQTHGRL
jgi:hypothetical protein